MEQASSHAEQYRNMTSQQRNAEMRRLFEFVPVIEISSSTNVDKPEKRFDFNDELAKSLGDVERRKKSILKQKLETRLKDLLPFAEVTDSYKSFIFDKFNYDFEQGAATSDYSKLFQWDNSESGGIFDKDKAKEIERIAYAREVGMQLFRMGLQPTEEELEKEDNNLKMRRARQEQLSKMPDEEIQKLDVREQEEAHFIQNRQRDEQERKKRLEIWRDEFVQKYGDEP